MSNTRHTTPPCSCPHPVVAHENLYAVLTALGADTALARALGETHPCLFSAARIAISPAEAAQMDAVIAAYQRLVTLPGYQAAVLDWAPPIARRAPGTLGALLGYDFHLTEQGPQLIEINTNAGGALLSIALARAQGEADEGAALAGIVSMFAAEWRRARGERPLTCVAIIDDAPTEQYLYPEFLLFAELLRRRGIAAEIAAPEALSYAGGALRLAGRRIDLVYNRLTDFSLEAAQYGALRQAYCDDAVVLTPHPHAHALFADKRNLTLLNDARRLQAWGLSAAQADVLVTGVPSTVIVTADNAGPLWTQRRDYFFKPARGYASKGVFRGDKLTRSTWQHILQHPYVAQALVSPRRHVIDAQGGATHLKYDLRNYVYDDRVLLRSARLYRGQATNFRTTGGGFAPVVIGAP